jgi:hypothetical protein
MRFGQYVEADIAAHLGPPVVLFGEHCADEADECGAVGEDADGDVGAGDTRLSQPRRAR